MSKQNSRIRRLDEKTQIFATPQAIIENQEMNEIRQRASRDGERVEKDTKCQHWQSLRHLQAPHQLHQLSTEQTEKSKSNSSYTDEREREVGSLFE